MLAPYSSTTSTPTDKIRVAHIASGDLWAGAEAQLFTLAVHLQHISSIELHIYLLNYGHLYERLAKAEIAVSVLDESELNVIGLATKLYRALRQFKPEVIHTHRLKENILGSILALLLGNTPCIRTVHGAPEHHHGFLKPHKLLQRYLDYFCGRYLQKSIIAVSQDLADQLAAKFPTCKIGTILNGVDSQAVEALAAQQTDINYSSTSAVRICFAGRLAPVKRIDLWLQTAARLVSRSNHQFEFYIIGDGPEKDRLLVLAETLKLENHIRFLGEHKNVPVLLKQMDILLLTSDHEGLPMVILEALCVQTLVIAHSVGGIKAVLENGQAGYLVTRHDANGYADQVLRSLQETSRVTAATNRGYYLVNSVYAASKCAEQYAAEYFALGTRRDP